MSIYNILAWQPLLRPPLPTDEPPAVPHIPLKALACRNSYTSIAALVTSDRPVRSARMVFSDLTCGEYTLPASLITGRLVGTVNTVEAGPVCDPLFEVDEFDIDRSAAIYATVFIPRHAPTGTYVGTAALVVDGQQVAVNDIQIEVANVVLPDVHNWDFFLNVWMNPAAIARVHGVEVWSDEHFAALKPYIEDLAAHGQKTVVAPICYQPWGNRMRDPYPSLIGWTKRGDTYEFDFTAFDRYVSLHAECGVDKAIHCFSIVQDSPDPDVSTLDYIDAASGERQLVRTHVGDDDYTQAWCAFLNAFAAHLDERGWKSKAHIAFSSKGEDVILRIAEFLSECGNDLRVAVASRDTGEAFDSVEDLSVQIEFDSRGVTDTAPPMRSAMGVAELLDPDNFCSITRDCPEKTSTTFYVCSAPQHPNTFVNSPLVESRTLPFLVLQGGFDGFVRWAYNEWSDEPFTKPGWDNWPTGDTFLVYPGENGPVSSLRWEQLREGIQDYELAMIASANIETPDEMVDYEQALTLACRDIDGRTKSTGDIEIARRLLIPIAEHKGE